MNIPTIGEKLALILTLDDRSNLKRMDRADMAKIAARIKGGPEKACIVEFDDKEQERINTLYYQFFS